LQYLVSSPEVSEARIYVGNGHDTKAWPDVTVFRIRCDGNWAVYTSYTTIQQRGTRRLPRRPSNDAAIGHDTDDAADAGDLGQLE
jgi:hypothetical protein